MTEKPPCACGYLDGQASQPDSPIRFDPELNEYHFVYRSQTGDEATLIIYHCPFCDGRMPKSCRSELFHRLTQPEQRRLCDLTREMRTVQDVLSAFGEPDVQRPTGIVVVTPERDSQPETTQGYPVMIYQSVSIPADMHVTIYPDDRVAISFQGKPKSAT